MIRCILQKHILQRSVRTNYLQLQTVRYVKKNYYEVLGVSSNATLKEIKLAHNRKCKEFHPDLNPELKTHDKIIEVNEAYSVLSNEIKKRDYDNSLSGPKHNIPYYNVHRPPRHQPPHSPYSQDYWYRDQHYREPYYENSSAKSRFDNAFNEHMKEKHKEDMYYMKRMARSMAVAFALYCFIMYFGYREREREKHERTLRSWEIKKDILKKLELQQVKKSLSTPKLDIGGVHYFKTVDTSLYRNQVHPKLPNIRHLQLQQDKESAIVQDTGG